MASFLAVRDTFAVSVEFPYVLPVFGYAVHTPNFVYWFVVDLFALYLTQSV